MSRQSKPPADGGQILSPQNPRLKAAAALRDRRDRLRQGRIVIDGVREILRALSGGIVLEELFVCEPLCRTADCRAALAEAARRHVPRVDISERAFEKLAFGERAEGIVAVGRAPSVALAGLVVPPNALVVVLEGIEKPGNLGAILRSADGAGADAVIVVGDGTDLFNPNAIRASAGTIFHVAVAAASTSAVLGWLREHHLRILAARVEGSRAYTSVDLTGPTAMVLGSEAEGLSPAWVGADIEAVALPMRGIADSLNVSVAAAVLLYEARRQRDGAATTDPQSTADSAANTPSRTRRRRAASQEPTGEG